MYHLDGNQVLSSKGVLIATLNENGDPVMAPGKKSQETKVRAFLSQNASASGPCNYCTDHTEQDKAETTHEPEPVEPEIGGGKVFVGEVPIKHVEPVAEPHEETDAEWYVSQIPEDRLPPFTPQFGIETPGFREFVDKNQLNKEQTVALVRRLERTR